MPLLGPKDRWKATKEDIPSLGAVVTDFVPDDGISPAPEGVGVTPPGPPAERGRHVGAAALSLISRFPLVGIEYLRDSAEVVLYDNQPPPSGEYAVQPLGITTIDYNGVKQNHLLVTFQAGLLAGNVQQTNYWADDLTLGIVTDFGVDIYDQLAKRAGAKLRLRFNRNISLKINDKTDVPLDLFAVASPYEIDLGLAVSTLYITTTQATKVKVEVY